MNKSMVDIIITTRNSEKYISHLLDTIKEQSYTDFICFVVDDNSSDKTKEIISVSYPWVKLLGQNQNNGPAKNRNIAVAQSSSPYLVFFDADVFLSDKEWLAKAVERISFDDNLGQLATMIVSGEDKDILLDCGIVWDKFLFNGVFHKKNKNHVWGKHLLGRPVVGACTAGTIVRRDVFEKVGGFDEKYFYMSEDLDLSLRIFLSGKSVEYEPSLVVNHYESHVMGKNRDLKEFFYFRNSFFLLLENYPLKLAFKKIFSFFLKFIVFSVINFMAKYVLRKNKNIAFLPVKNVFKIFFALLLKSPSIFKKRFTSRKYINRPRADLLSLNDQLLKSLDLELPVTNLILSITNVCNAKCRMCFQYSILNQTAELLSLDEIRKLVESTPLLNNVVLSGGEPFLRGDIDKLCEVLIKTRNPVITIPTNGSLPDLMYTKTKEILAHSGRKLVISLSLDGNKEFHDKNRGIPGLFEKVFECYERLEALNRIYGDKLLIQINTCVSKDNFDQVDYLADLIATKMPCAEWMVEPVRGFFNQAWVSPLSFDDWQKLSLKMENIKKSGVFSGRDFSVLKKNYYYALKTLEQKKQPVPCCGGESFLYIDHEGNISPCEFMSPLANLREIDYDLNALLGLKKWTAGVAGIKKGSCFCTHFCWLSSSVEKSELAKSVFSKAKKFIIKHLE